ncbi:MAG TPA: outer membrane beta-barrel protein [Puia sp.]|nr:outer membrane beta-barrel protein [Puia sp.]
MKCIKCLVILCLLYAYLPAQQIFDPGYIISLNRDTVNGFIKADLESDLISRIHFKNDEGSLLKDYGPADLLGFGIGKDIYKSMRFLNTAEDSIMETAFVKQLVKGEYNLYAYRKPDRFFYLIQNDTTLYFLYDEVSRGTGEIMQKGNFYNYLNLIAVPCEKLTNLVGRVGYNDKDMAGFISKVDNCETPGIATNYYQKPKTLVQPMIFAGGLPVAEKNQFTASFILHITLPRIDKKTSINIGINYSNLTKKTEERSDYYFLYDLFTHYQIYSVPVTFQYNFTTSRVQPYFYVGISPAYTSRSTNTRNYNIPASDHDFGLALVAGLGVQVRMISKLFLRADWRYEVVLQYPAVGIAYQF